MSFAIFCVVACLGSFAMIDVTVSQHYDFPSAEEQCSNNGFEGICQPAEDPSICGMMRCATRHWDGYTYSVPYKPAATGTACGETKICQNNQCVDWNPDDMHHRKLTKGWFNCRDE